MKKNIIQAISAIVCIIFLGGCTDGPDYSREKTIFVDHASLYMYYDDVVQITASPTLESFQWESADASIASVTDGGLVKATGVGLTEIYVSYGDVRRTIPVEVSIPRAEKVSGRPGKNRVAVDMDIQNEFIKSVKITCIETGVSSTTDVNFQKGLFTAFYEGLEDGLYTFNVICMDKFNNEAVPLEIAIRSYGSAYQNSFVVARPFRVASALGNGLCIGWNSLAGMYVDLTVTGKDGSQATKRIYGDTDSYTLDYQFDPVTSFSYITAYLPEENCIDTFYTQPMVIEASLINDLRYFITKDETITIRTRDFNLGGHGVGYFDKMPVPTDRPGNRTYRPNIGDYNSPGPDIEGDSNFGYTANGYWYDYTVYVQDAGNYVFDAQVGVNNAAGSTYYVAVDGVNVTGDVQMRNMSSWGQSWYYAQYTDESPPVIHFTAGLHTIRWYFVVANANLNALSLTYQD